MNLEAVKYLLKQKRFREMIDFTDDLDTTAAGYATQAGLTEILECLLDYKAQIKSDAKTGRLNIFDASYGYFKTGDNCLKAILKFCTKDEKFAIVNVQEVLKRLTFCNTLLTRP